MERLYAPWRETYITKIIDKQKSCVFCRILKDTNDAKNLIFLRGQHSFAVLNLYPYSNGHCLVLPNSHTADISRLSTIQWHAMADMVIVVQKLLKKTMKPVGFNIGMNLGRIAGAGIPGHAHIHIVPRWKGDHNFMPVTAQTKVISQSLPIIYRQLKNAHT